MGLIFDAGAAQLYEAWHQSPEGMALERLVKDSLVRLLEAQRGERILDIGCGEGRHLKHFCDLGLNGAGVDASPYMVQRARERLGRRAILDVGRAENLPYQDNEFDLALFINTLEFLDDPVEAVREAGRVARRGVFIAVMNSLSWHCFCMKLRALFEKSIFTYATSYNLWEVKAFVHSALGDVPIHWRSAQSRAPTLKIVGRFFPEGRDLDRSLFGSCLGLSATIKYTVRTIQNPLKAHLAQAGRPVVKGAVMGEVRNERSLPL